MEWGNRWLVTFNATKTKLLSFNRHRDPLLVPVKMSSTELHEETSFRLLGLTFTPTVDWKPYIQSGAKAASRKVGSLFRGQRFLSPESILYLYNVPRPCMEYCAHIGGCAPMSKGLDLPGANGCAPGQTLCPGLLNVPRRQMLLASACCKVLLSGQMCPELADLVPPKRGNCSKPRFSGQMCPVEFTKVCPGATMPRGFFPRTQRHLCPSQMCPGARCHSIQGEGQ